MTYNVSSYHDMKRVHAFLSELKESPVGEALQDAITAMLMVYRSVVGDKLPEKATYASLADDVIKQHQEDTARRDRIYKKIDENAAPVREELASARMALYAVYRALYKQNPADNTYEMIKDHILEGLQTKTLSEDEQEAQRQLEALYRLLLDQELPEECDPTSLAQKIRDRCSELLFRAEADAAPTTIAGLYKKLTGDLPEASDSAKVMSLRITFEVNELQTKVKRLEANAESAVGLDSLLKIYRRIMRAGPAAKTPKAPQPDQMVEDTLKRVSLLLQHENVVAELRSLFELHKADLLELPRAAFYKYTEVKEELKVSRLALVTANEERARVEMVLAESAQGRKNKEGMTYGEWLGAANPSKSNIEGTFVAWERGEDPTDWRAALSEKKS